MRCYFLRNDRVWSAEALTALGEETALAEAKSRLRKQLADTPDLDGFEIWDGSRCIRRYALSNGYPP